MFFLTFFLVLVFKYNKYICSMAVNDNFFNPNSYWENRLSKISGLEGVGFKKLGKSFNKWAYKVRKQVFVREVNKLKISFPTLKILDIGSGTGFYIQIWKEIGGLDITGVDITETSVENLKKVFPQQLFFQSDIGDNKFNEKKQYSKYDIISAMDVLFHIVDDKRFEQAIKNVSSLLEKDGYFIYSDNFLRKETIRGESQVSRSEKYLYNVFSQNDLELVTIRPFMFFTNSPIDSSNPLLKLYWYLLENGLYIIPYMGKFIGPSLYPLEMSMVNKSKSGPTTKIAIFKKK